MGHWVKVLAAKCENLSSEPTWGSREPTPQVAHMCGFSQRTCIQSKQQQQQKVFKVKIPIRI